MSSPTITTTGDNRFKLSGDLDFSTVGDLFDQGQTLFAANEKATLDLADVDRANGAGLALLLEWLAHAKRDGRKLELLNLPASLTAIARMSNVLDLLPVADSAN